MGTAVYIIETALNHYLAPHYQYRTFHFSMREMSRILVLPMTQEAGPCMDARVDDCLDKAGGGLGRLVALGQDLPDSVPRVSQLAADITELLPQTDAARRIAKNYAMLATFAEMVSTI